jgi:CheY-like chemotaxis protein
MVEIEQEVINNNKNISKYNIFVVEDTNSHRNIIKEYLTDCNVFAVDKPKSFPEIISSFLNQKIDGILIDINLNEYKIPEYSNDNFKILNGVDIANKLRKYCPPNITIALISTDIQSSRLQKSIEEIEPHIKVYDKNHYEKDIADFLDNIEYNIAFKERDLDKNYSTRYPNEILQILDEPSWLVEKDGVIDGEGSKLL